MSVLDLRMYLHRPISIYNFFDKTCPVFLLPLEEDGGIASLGSTSTRASRMSMELQLSN
jgi:hypothetical protein